MSRDIYVGLREVEGQRDSDILVRLKCDGFYFQADVESKVPIINGIKKHRGVGSIYSEGVFYDNCSLFMDNLIGKTGGRIDYSQALVDSRDFSRASTLFLRGLEEIAGEDKKFREEVIKLSHDEIDKVMIDYSPDMPKSLIYSVIRQGLFCGYLMEKCISGLGDGVDHIKAIKVEQF